MLSKMIGFVYISDAEAAKQFYVGKLGFKLVSDDQFAVVFDANGTKLRAGKGRTSPPGPGTVCGWEVPDVRAAVRELGSKGVKCEQFNLPFLKQDELGVWTAPNGDDVAWFKDPDGNTLSVSHHV